MLSKNHIVKILFLIILLNPQVFTQQKDIVKNNSSLSDTTEFEMTKSPWGAVFRSAILPGWGQFYNESYLKIPVVWGILGSLVYGWINYNDDYHYYRELYVNTELDRHRQLRNFYRDQRDLFAIYIGLGYLLNLVDAYVDAQLFDFTVEENYLTKQPMLGIQIKF